MAKLSVSFILGGLRHDAPKAFTPGSDLDLFLVGVRSGAADALAAVPELRYSDSTDRLSTDMEFIQNAGPDPVSVDLDPAAPTTELIFTAHILVDDDVARGYRSEGNPVDEFVRQFGQALGSASQALPNNGAAMFTALGFQQDEITSTIRMKVEAPRAGGRSEA